MSFQFQQAVTENVLRALAEDVGSGDISAALIPETDLASARVITREQSVICGQAWVNEVFRQLNPAVTVKWSVEEGVKVEAGTPLFELAGPARDLLSGERTALNFLQFLSGIATRCRYYADLVSHTSVKLLDTRKTIPGLRVAQKYAVTKGGCFNHRFGLYDAFLIKENHIKACGGITNAVRTARDQNRDCVLEVEVENLEELREALNTEADLILLDNFEISEMREAKKISHLKLEASGGITVETIKEIAETGVDYISIGALTKDSKAIDLSMRFN